MLAGTSQGKNKSWCPGASTYWLGIQRIEGNILGDMYGEDTSIHKSLYKDMRYEKYSWIIQPTLNKE